MNYITNRLHFKEKKPEETVTFLKKILNDAEIDVDEIWEEKSIIDTYSVRVLFHGTDVGANGKGISKAYARASAYAELFERLQNGILGPEYRYYGDVPYNKAVDEKIMNSNEIVEQSGAFMNYVYDSLGISSMNNNDKAEFIKKKYKMDSFIFGADDKYITIPFQNLNTNTIEYLPFYIYHLIYTSNGMCAGNSKEEALVQGLSEIMERVVQKKLFLEKPTLPDIPEYYIKKYPYIYDMYCKIKSLGKYEIYMKDCSFGGKYPVAGLVIIEKNTGKYGIKLGCHPDFGIAMERTFTEVTQGNDIDIYAQRSVLDFSNNLVDNQHNIFNSFKIGLAQYPYEIFAQTPTYEFIEPEDVSMLSNKELLNRWLDSITAEGFEILLRDVSYSGFPSYHIIIPGLSEMVNPNSMMTHAIQTRYYITELLRNPEQITKDNVKYVIGVMEFFMNSALDNTLSSFYSTADIDLNILPYERYGLGAIYLLAMCNILKEDYKQALDNIQRLEKNIIYRKKKDDDIYNQDCINLRAIKIYLQGIIYLKDHSECMGYIQKFFDQTYCNKINNLFENKKDILKKQYPTITKLKREQKDINFITKFYNYTIHN